MSRSRYFAGKPVVVRAFALGTFALAGTAHAGSFTQLYDFQGSNGGQPAAALLLENGNLYGTASLGGPDNGGVVFELTSGGTQTVLHQFADGTDGFTPMGGLIADKQGNLYGTTMSGGDGCDQAGCGTIFKLAPDGTETILHAFADGNDGANPTAGLLADKRGNFYGTTLYGGSGGQGTVFKLASDGSESVLYAFKGGNDGAEPQAGLIEDKRGNLYGTTVEGGSGAGGTVFKLAPDGTETILFSFDPANLFGAAPHGALIMDENANLYGTATIGGAGNCQDHCGTIFEIAANGDFSALYRFTGGTDGAYPESALIEDKKGNFYGTTGGGGNTDCGGVGCGAVFKLTPRGKLTTLYAFTGGTNGAEPFAPAIADKQGNLFGTTMYDGYSCTDYALQGCGTIYEVRK
jgi:uncharacterized repeat protein (TIGR03803 family)